MGGTDGSLYSQERGRAGGETVKKKEAQVFSDTKIAKSKETWETIGETHVLDQSPITVYRHDRF